MHVEEREIRGVIRNEIERPIHRGRRPQDDAIELMDQAFYLVRTQPLVFDHEHPKASGHWKLRHAALRRRPEAVVHSR
jgi:hypothetical protein